VKECNQCGKCCIKYSNGGLSVSASEIESWDIFRPELLKYVRDGNIWINPDTGKPLELCPWLTKLADQNKYICDIYHDRPDDCKYYPVTIEQMINDDCEMLEPNDIKKPKQAQKILDNLMSDSRPPFEEK